MAVKSLKAAIDDQATSTNDNKLEEDEDEEEEVFDDCLLVNTNNNETVLDDEESTNKQQHNNQYRSNNNQPLSFLMSSLTSLGPNNKCQSLSSSSSFSSSHHNRSSSPSSSVSSSMSSSLVCGSKKLKLSSHHHHNHNQPQSQSSSNSPNHHHRHHHCQTSKFSTLRRKILRRGCGDHTGGEECGGKKSVLKKTTPPKSSSSSKSKSKGKGKSKKHHMDASLMMNASSTLSMSSSAYTLNSLATSTSRSSSAAHAAKRMKFLLVGDANCGKTAIMSLFLNRPFHSNEYRPTIVDDYEVRVNHNGELYTLNLYDTAGQEDWETLRIMAYPETDVIILCFSVVRPDSMENIATKWIPELNKFIPGVIIILVGTQCDLRETAKLNASDPKERHISTSEGEELRAKIKAFKYIECSAVTQLNINEIFNTCVEAYTRLSAHKKSDSQPSCFHSLFTQLTSSIRRRFSFRRSTPQQQSDLNAPTTSRSNTNKSANKKKKKHES